MRGYLKMQQNLKNPPKKCIADADAACLFPTGLEYNPPARGMWNIVQMGMLIPDAHQIYGCAQGCLRGVVLTAAEMNALERLSWISLTEEDMFNGTLEQSLVDGVSEIVDQLDRRPPVVLLFLSCMHLFAGCDFDAVISDLSAAYPEICFVDCYMTPTMRDSVPPVVQTCRQMYVPLKPLPKNPKAAAIIGNDRPTDEDAELIRILRGAGYRVHDLTRCKSYDEYLQIAESSLNITYLPTAFSAGELLTERFGTPCLHLPNSFDYDEIAENYRRLCEAIGADCPDFSAEISAADQALERLHETVGDTKIAIDYTVVTQPFSLAKLLCQHGMNVKYIIADTVGEDAAAFKWLQQYSPDIEIYAPANVNMLHQPEQAAEPVLAIGQKAAYYFASDHFVNLILNGGFYGFAGICRIAELTEDAFRTEKDRRAVLRHKGFGCASCLL